MQQDNYDHEYSQIKQHILHNIHYLNKHQKIRVNQWLQKLDITTTNDIWKKNKNFYMKTLLQMVTDNLLLKPFSQAPPEGPLPKLSVYDIEYPIRQKIQGEQNKKSSYKKRSCSRNSHSRSQKNSSRQEHKKSVPKRQGLMAHKKKIVFDNYISNHESKQDSENCSIFGNLNKTMKTQQLFFGSTEQQQIYSYRPHNKKQKSKCKSKQKQRKQEPQIKTTREYLKKQKGLNILRRTLRLLGDHYDQLHGQQKYKSMLQKIVDVGDSMNENLRQVSIRNQSEESTRFQKYSERIKEKLMETDLNSLQFLSYLRKVNSSK